MPEEVDINSDKYMKEFLNRLQVLSQTGNICTLKTDEGRWVLCEIWHFPEKQGTEGEYEIFPFAMFMSDEEIANIKLEGQTPERDENEYTRERVCFECRREAGGLDPGCNSCNLMEDDEEEED